MFSNSFAGIAPASVPGFVVAELVGAGIGAGIVAAERIALTAQRRHDAFAIDEGFGAAEADEANFWRLAHVSGGSDVGIVARVIQKV